MLTLTAWHDAAVVSCEAGQNRPKTRERHDTTSAGAVIGISDDFIREVRRNA